MVDDGAPTDLGLLGKLLETHPGPGAHDREQAVAKGVLEDGLAPDPGEEEEERERGEARVKDEEYKEQAEEERGARMHRVQARGAAHKYRAGPGPFVRFGTRPSGTIGSFGNRPKPGTPVRPVSAKAAAKMV